MKLSNRVEYVSSWIEALKQIRHLREILKDYDNKNFKYYFKLFSSFISYIKDNKYLLIGESHDMLERILFKIKFIEKKNIQTEHDKLLITLRKIIFNFIVQNNKS